MSSYTIYALRVEYWGDRVYSSLQSGVARFGWSRLESGDLHKLKAKMDANGWDSLSGEEQECYQGFLLDIEKDDFLVHINVPEWGKCTLSRVTGPYFWRYEEEDFNHRIPVDPGSVKTFGWNDDIVHPALSTRLKLQGRWWRIYVQEKFERLVEALEEGMAGKVRTPETNRRLLMQEIQPLLRDITGRIQDTHPNFDLEGLVEELLWRVPGVQDVSRHRGRGDYGADLTVVFESGLPIPGFQRQQTCVVQVKSHQGTQPWNTRAIDDIRRAFSHYPEAEMGLIISTASSSSEDFDKELDALREETGKPVSLLIGADLASFFLRFGSDLLD